MRIAYNTMKSRPIRERSKTMNRFFKEHDEYFGFGIYVFEK